MKVLLVFCAILISITGKCQTSNEWLQQKKTKLKYIAQQIAELQVYADCLQKGYHIVEDGWSAVNDVKHGDFDLHNNYFNSLRQVNVSIASYSRIDSITAMQTQILQVNDAINKLIQDNDNVQPDETEYIKKVMSNLLNKCADDLDELRVLTTNDSLQMKDDERLQRIDNLYSDMQDKYSFAQYFNNSIETLALSRAKNTNDINTSKLLYGIK